MPAILYSVDKMGFTTLGDVFAFAHKIGCPITIMHSRDGKPCGYRSATRPFSRLERSEAWIAVLPPLSDITFRILMRTGDLQQLQTLWAIEHPDRKFDGIEPL